MRGFLFLASAGLIAVSVMPAFGKSSDASPLVFQAAPAVVTQAIPAFGERTGSVVSQTPPAVISQAMPVFGGAEAVISSQWSPNVVGQPMSFFNGPAFAADRASAPR